MEYRALVGAAVAAIVATMAAQDVHAKPFVLDLPTLDWDLVAPATLQDRPSVEAKGTARQHLGLTAVKAWTVMDQFRIDATYYTGEELEFLDEELDESYLQHALLINGWFVLSLMDRTINLYAGAGFLWTNLDQDKFGDIETKDDASYTLMVHVALDYMIIDHGKTPSIRAIAFARNTEVFSSDGFGTPVPDSEDGTRPDDYVRVPHQYGAGISAEWDTLVLNSQVFYEDTPSFMWWARLHVSWQFLQDPFPLAVDAIVDVSLEEELAGAEAGLSGVFFDFIVASYWLGIQNTQQDDQELVTRVGVGVRW